MTPAEEQEQLQREIESLCLQAEAAGFVVLTVRCCCCGADIDKLPTPWPAHIVRPEWLWTREPCIRCQIYYATHGEYPL